MEKDFHKEIKGIKEVKMTAAEKQAILARILPHTAKRRVPSPFVFIWQKRYSSLVAACLILILASGGTIFASENALPGDLLYPIKINVAEAAGDLLTVGTDSKAKREAEKVDTRLNEAEQLASEGRLSPDRVETINQQVGRQIKRLSAIKNELEKTAPPEVVADIYSDVEARIAAHANILEGVRSHSRGQQRDEIEKLKKQADQNDQEAKNELKSIRQKAAEKNTDRSDNNDNKLEDHKRDVAKQIESARKDIRDSSRSSDETSKDILENASGTLSQAEQKLNEAENMIKSGKRKEAREAVNEAKRDAKVADISVKKSRDLKGRNAEKQDRQEKRDQEKEKRD